jgi:hypothetical protein
MNMFNSVPEPGATIIGAVGAIGLGAFGALLLGLVLSIEIAIAFGAGALFGTLVCLLLRWCARIDERPFWQHILGRNAVYPELEEDNPLKP